jgi:hypothetical protein
MPEAETQKKARQAARDMLRMMGFTDEQIHEEYSIIIRLSQKEMESFARWEAQEKWGNSSIRKICSDDELLKEKVRQMERAAYENIIARLRENKTYEIGRASCRERV